MGVSYTQITYYFRLRKEKINNEALIEIKDCRQAKMFNGREQPNRWKSGLLPMSRGEDNTLVDLFAVHTEMNYRTHNTGGFVNPVCKFSGADKKSPHISSVNVRQYRTSAPVPSSLALKPRT